MEKIYVLGNRFMYLNEKTKHTSSIYGYVCKGVRILCITGCHDNYMYLHYGERNALQPL